MQTTLPALRTPPTTPDAPTTLHAFLDANLHLPPEYNDQLTNHLPMALHALHSLGASPARMQAFYDAYRQRFQGRTVPQAASPVVADVQMLNWHALRGQDGAYPALLAYFTERLAHQGVDTALREALPALMPGVAAAAFHGVIRTAHAVQAGHARELATALAYWAWRWQPLATPPAAPALLEREAWSARLVQGAIGWRSPKPLISLRMADAAQSELYRALGAALAPAPSLAARVRELALLAVQRYVANPNFTVLHMVTGLRAVRTLLPWLGDAMPAQDLLAQNFVVAYLAAQVKPLTAPPSAPAATWDAAIAAAIASDDDHVVKLVHACREEATAYGEGDYLHAATLVTAR